MTPPFKLGILETGRPPESLQQQVPNYAVMTEEMLRTDGTEHWSFRHYAALDGELPERAGECDAYLITGSKFGAYEDIGWIHDLEHFLRRAYEDGVPIVGICFGHQILAQSLGGRVIKSNKGWAVGTHNYQWTERAPSWLANTGLEDSESFAIQAYHQDQIVQLPPTADVLAQSDHCPYAVLAYGDQALSFQGHPEFSSRYIAKLVEERRGSTLTEAIADRAIESLRLPIDNESYRRWDRFIPEAA